MINLLTFMEFASFHYLSEEDMSVPIILLRGIAERCGFSIVTKRKNGQTLYRLKREKIPCEKLYDHTEKCTFNFIDLADLHLGHPDCELDRIKETLRYAVCQQVDYVFIAGDLLDGVYDVKENNLEETLEKQLDIAYSIFKKYPLDFRVIPGNHEFSFDLCRIWNPLRILEERLKGEECHFKVYDSYIQDFEIAGVIKRMIHLESYYHKDNEYSVVQRLHEFDENEGLFIKGENGIKKPVRFMQCGHIHKRLEIFDSDLNVFITQPGSYIREQNFRIPFIHVKGEVLDDLRIVRG